MCFHLASLTTLPCSAILPLGVAFFVIAATNSQGGQKVVLGEGMLQSKKENKKKRIFQNSKHLLLKIYQKMERGYKSPSIHTFIPPACVLLVCLTLLGLCLWECPHFIRPRLFRPAEFRATCRKTQNRFPLMLFS